MSGNRERNASLYIILESVKIFFYISAKSEGQMLFFPRCSTYFLAKCQFIKAFEEIDISKVRRYYYLMAFFAVCRDKRKDKKDAACILRILTQMIEVSPYGCHVLPLLFIAEQELYCERIDDAKFHIELCRSIMKLPAARHSLWLLFSLFWGR